MRKVSILQRQIEDGDIGGRLLKYIELYSMGTRSCLWVLVYIVRVRVFCFDFLHFFSLGM